MDDFEKMVDEWANAERECVRLYALWSEACHRRRVLARAKNQVWREMNAASVTELSKNNEFNPEREYPGNYGAISNGER